VQRRSRAIAVGVFAALALAAPVQAAKPEFERIQIDDHFVDEFLSDECGTEITADVTGHINARAWVDANDELTHEVVNFAIQIRWSSEHGSIFAHDVGVDRITYLDDGSIIQAVIGGVQSFTAQGMGRVYADVGRTVLHITFDDVGNASVEVISQSGQHDEDQTGAICSVLGG
jgi:hypothetical protein